MAVTPPTGPGGLGTQAAATFKGIPFWDEGAYPFGTVVSVDPNTGAKTISQAPAPGIITLLPETPNGPWLDDISEWETIYFNGMMAPGIARVKGGRRRRIDLRITPGASGATASNMGYDPGEFTVTLTLWTAKQWKWLQDMMGMLLPPPTAKVQPRSVKVNYPALRIVGITDCYIESVAIPEVNEQQIGRVEFDCLEFLPQQNEGGGVLAPASEWTQNPDGTWSSVSRSPPADPSITSIAP